jgi:PhzF family phenazine biosynthesis protein
MRDWLLHRPGRARHAVRVTDILRYAAFSTDPAGGNPAGVVLDAAGLPDQQMLKIAAEVGYSETAFITERPAPDEYRVRYFSPLAEVPFCGHATVATAVALGPGRHVFVTNAGQVPVSVDDHGRATLTSVAARVAPMVDEDRLLAALRWSPADLDPALPLRIAYAGAHHPIVAAATRARLADLDYDRPALTALMHENDWTTIQLVHRESPALFHVRNPFPIGGIYEDPATGAAAAALGGYLRELALAGPDAVVQLHQGDDMGRPGRLTVTLTPGEPGIRVSGSAVPI